jgi:hypothetical protein
MDYHTSEKEKEVGISETLLQKTMSIKTLVQGLVIYIIYLLWVSLSSST